MELLGAGTLSLIGITFFAAFVNGALGYGFSSLTVPVALLFYANRIINPALVLIEVPVNIYVLVMNRASIPAVWKRIYPIVIGLLPGIAIGSYMIASIHPGWMKLATYLFVLPLILVQAAGIRRPIRSEKTIGVPFGLGLGFLYSLTTISGPPLALLFNNQGLVKRDFRAGLALIRVAESSLTAIVYYNLGLFVADSFSIVKIIIPGIAIGIPLGTYFIRHIEPETFRRICMSFDVWIVGFGLSRVMVDLKLAHGLGSFWPMFVAILLDGCLLYRFFSRRQARSRITTSESAITGSSLNSSSIS